MAPPLVSALIAAFLSLMPGWLGGSASAQAPQEAPVAAPEVPDTSLSPECRVPGSKLYTIASLRGVKSALKERRVIRVLAIGSSSTAGIGASSPQATYPARLEGELEKMFSDDVDFEVINRGVSGEVAADAADRMRNTVAEVDPDLVIWQVGTNDALARVDVESFTEELADTVRWLKSHNIDVVLVDPQYTASLARHDYYGRIIKAIEDVARRDRVPLVRRFESMRHLAGQQKTRGYLATDQFHLNDLGYRCMAEHVARAITVGLIQAEAPPAGNSSLDVSTTAKISPVAR
ncbi:MAG TPA: SGNH/GDSL hydrolase family protein [Beijerinckiaceae bacterium]|jgi:acyl-CoA thioesterase-1|nr:SGNH/GDSL hydrolase family protein [Beijerinckiaceae bacterium]